MQTHILVRIYLRIKSFLRFNIEAWLKCHVPCTKLQIMWTRWRKHRYSMCRIEYRYIAANRDVPKHCLHDHNLFDRMSMGQRNISIAEKKRFFPVNFSVSVKRSNGKLMERKKGDREKQLIRSDRLLELSGVSEKFMLRLFCVVRLNRSLLRTVKWEKIFARGSILFIPFKKNWWKLLRDFEKLPNVESVVGD